MFEPRPLDLRGRQPSNQQGFIERHPTLAPL